MKTKNVTRKQFIGKCPICKREIKGTSESQVRYNLKVHKSQRHRREK
jgi:hypothetical protein